MSHGPPRRLVSDLRFGFGLLATVLVGGVLTLLVWAVIPGVMPGWSTSVVESGSMGPLIEEGDLVVVRPAPVADLDTGTVILFGTADGPTLHRIERVEDAGYVTRGDANGSADTDVVAPDRVDGVGTVLVPFMGRPLRWLAEGRWGLLALMVVTAVSTVRACRWASDPGLDPWRPGARPHRPAAERPTMFGRDVLDASPSLLSTRLRHAVWRDPSIPGSSP